MPPNPIAHLLLFSDSQNALSDYHYNSRMNAYQIHTTQIRWVPDQSLVSASQEFFASPPIIAIRPHWYLSSGSGMELNATSTNSIPNPRWIGLPLGLLGSTSPQHFVAAKA